MKKLSLALLCAHFLLRSPLGLATELVGDTVIRGVNLVDVKTMTIQTNMDVLIGGSRILKVGRELNVEAKHSINGQNRYLSPGLIDSHTHLGGVPGMSYQQMRKNKKLTKRAQEQMPRSYLYHGFTTVIDLHSDAQNIEQWNAQAVRPQAYFCGGAPIINGYPMNYIPKSVRYRITPYFIVEDGSNHKKIKPELHSPKAVIKRMRERGAVCVKTHYEAGFANDADLPLPSKRLIKNLVSEAHSQNLKVLLHANSQQAQRFGLDVGVDAFVHGMWHWNKPNSGSLANNIKSDLNSAIENRINLQPTFQVLYGERDLHNPSYLTQTELGHVLPKALIEWYASRDGQSFKEKTSSHPYIKKQLSEQSWRSIDAEPIERLELTFDHWLTNNGELLFGSDTPSAPTFANPPGLNGRFEMQHWEAAGVTATQFLAAATIKNAEFFNLGNEIGSIEAGKRADLLLLSENPLISIRAFDHIETVFVKGKTLKRHALSAAQFNAKP